MEKSKRGISILNPIGWASICLTALVFCCLLQTHCIFNSERKNKDIRIPLETRLYPNAGPFYGMRNLFFEESDGIDIHHPPEWKGISIASLLQDDHFKPIYVLQYKDSSGESQMVIDTDADSDFGNEVPLVFARHEEFLIADAKLDIHSLEEPGTDVLRMDYQVLKRDPYIYARIREYRKGILIIDGQSYTVSLRPSSVNSPVFRLSPKTTCLIDSNRDGEVTEFWTLNEGGDVVPSERVELGEPFLIGRKTMKAVSIDPHGAFLILSSAKAEIGTALGFIGPDLSAVDIDGNTHRLTFYKGTPLLLEFWSIHCPWSEVVRPAINALIEKHPDLVVLSLAKEKDKEEIRKFMESYQNRSLVLPRNDSAWQIYNPETVTPMFYLFDGDGKIEFKGRGASMVKILDKIIL